MSSNSSKRPHEADGNYPSFENPLDLINAVNAALSTPDEVTNVSLNFSNDKNSASEVQAYAKISGNSWTYYVKQLSVLIGRNTEGAAITKDLVDIDLGPAKVVSRAHAAINYNLVTRVWELVVSGRNGAKVDGNRVGINEPTALHSGAIVDIGGTQMMFILPDLTPTVAPLVLAQLAPRFHPNGTLLKKPNLATRPFVNSNPQLLEADNLRHGMMKSTLYNPSMMKGHPNSTKGNASTVGSVEQDLSRDDSRDTKPPYSYATMITQSILSNPEGALSLSEIYDWISLHYAFYRYSKTGWQNLIRHNLSLNKAFEKVPRKPNEPGKGMKWQISQAYKEEFLTKLEDGSLSKVRRGSSVSRQLQLHLSTHSHLPGERKPVALVGAEGKPPPSLYPVSHGYGQVFLPQLQQGGAMEPAFEKPCPDYQTSDYIKLEKADYHSGYGTAGFSGTHLFGKLAPGADFDKAAVFAQHPDRMPTHMAPPTPLLSNFAKPEPHSSSHDALSFITHTAMPPPASSLPLSRSQGSADTKATSDKNPLLSPIKSNGIAGSTLPLSETHSPRRYGVSVVEAYTPERGKGPKASHSTAPGANPSGNPQSSPGVWNFMQFSTPNHKDGDSPPRRSTAGLGSPVKGMGTRASPDEMRGVDLARGFRKSS